MKEERYYTSCLMIIRSILMLSLKNHLKSLYSMAKQQFEEEKDTYNLIDF